ncbi:uncharacterized protein [Anabrus simplex]|uniref:uncharacterized protein n=1 Tax=Anabrus simplex TaxID=316456 RepID=UPI0035A28CEA
MTASGLFILLALVSTLPVNTLGDSINNEVSTSEDNLTAGLKLIYNTYQQCEEQVDVFGCLKVRALKVLHRAVQADSLSLVDGISLVKTEEGSRAIAQPLQEVDESRLPQDPHKKQEILDDMIADHVARFIKTHTLQFKMPKFITEIVEEQEGRRRKGGGGKGVALLLGLMMKGGLMAMAYKGVAILAAKALMVAKIALVLAAVAGLSSLAGGGGGKTTYEIVKHPHVSHSYSHTSSHVGPEHYGGGDGHYEVSGGGGGHHGWGRSLDTELYPQVAAFHGQLPPHLQLSNDAPL